METPDITPEDQAIIQRYKDSLVKLKNDRPRPTYYDYGAACKEHTEAYAEFLVVADIYDLDLF